MSQGTKPELEGLGQDGDMTNFILRVHDVCRMTI